MQDTDGAKHIPLPLNDLASCYHRYGFGLAHLDFLSRILIPEQRSFVTVAEFIYNTKIAKNMKSPVRRKIEINQVSNWIDRNQASGNFRILQSNSSRIKMSNVSIESNLEIFLRALAGA